MQIIWSFIRHNSGIIISSAMIPFVLIFAYSCQSVVVSSLQPGEKVTRAELVSEVDFFLTQAELKFADLDRQDLVKETIFNSLVEVAQGGQVNPLGVLLMAGNLLGLGAVVDNVRKRTHINTLKGGHVNGKEAKQTKT